MEMRIVFLLIVAGVSNIFASSSYSQIARISLDMENARLEQVMDEIENRSEFYFLLNQRQVDVNRTVSIQVENELIDKILGQIFDGTDVNFFVLDRQVLLTKDPLGNKLIENKATNELQQTTVTGTITDSETGDPMPGVNVIVKGTNIGVLSDVNGRYSITVPDMEAVLSFSFIGYNTQEISIENRSTINVEMVQSLEALEEVVVVGYGTQKKINLTGAVDQVENEVLNQRPINNLTQGLQGVVPNLTIVLDDGKPIRTSDYVVRGTSSIGQGGAALTLIDGIEGDLSLVNPNDIESISVLKDASSASIYGARGAFGVILVTTKTPSTGKISVDYNMNFGIKSPTAVPDFVTNGYTYAKWFSEAYNAYYDYSRIPTQINKTQRFSLEYLEELKRRDENPSLPDIDYDSDGNYVYYSDFDWFKELYVDNLVSMDHNLSVSGTQNKISYYLSGRYNTQEGLFRYNSDDYKMYNFRAKGTVDITDWLKIENNAEYAEQSYHQPLNVGEGGGIWRNIADEGHPTSPMLNPDGTLTHSAAYTVGDFWYGKNGEDKTRKLFRNITGITAQFFDNKLRIKGDFTFSSDFGNAFRRRIQLPFSRKPDVIEYVGTTYNDIREYNSETRYLATNVYGEYENTFNQDHYLKVMTGFNYEARTYKQLLAQRNGILFEDAEDISLTVGENITIDGGYNRWRIAGQFYRINYSYKNKYLIELDGRLDASSKFPADQTTAFFPSVSIGYRISNESFWNISETIISDLKLRASYGSLGNGNVNPYTYLELFSISQSGRILNGIRPNRTSQPTIIPEGLTWETSTTTNFGLDASFLSGKLVFSGDIYTRMTTDMYTVGIPVPAVFGATVPKGNYADLKTKGWEISLSWKDDFMVAAKPFNYDIRFVLADSKSEVLKYNNPNKLLSDYYEGMEIGEMWGYITEGLFIDAEDVATHANQSYIRVSSNNILLPGDVKFKDTSNDGKIDEGLGRVDDPGDLQIIGNSAPRYTFGFNFSANWNNFFLSAFFQGVGKQDWWPGGEASHFFGQYNRPYNNMPKWHLDNIWSEDNPDAYLPRYRGYIARSNRELHKVQTRYLQDVAYIRLKNFQIGYNVNKNLLSKTSFIDELSVYLSTENIWSWSPLYKTTRDFDVANIGPSDTDITSGTSGNILNYPLLKTVSLGLAVKF